MRTTSKNLILPFTALLIAVVFGLVSCSAVETRQALTDVESFINDRPDSALAILRQMDQENMSGRETKARYAILMTMAAYKCDIIMTNDSLIRTAADYYSGRRGAKSGNVKYRFLAMYHWGNVLYNAGSFPQAIIAYNEADKLSDKLNDGYLTGLLQVSVGQTYTQYCDYTKALEAYQSAYENYTRAGKDTHAAHCLYSLGQMYWNNMDFEKGENVIRRAYASAEKLEDENLRRVCLEGLIVLYDQTGDYDKEQIIIDSLRHSFGTDNIGPQTLNAIANTFYLSDRPDSAKFFSQLAWSKAQTPADTVNLYLQTGNVLKSLGENATALELFHTGNEVQSRLLRECLRQPLLTAQNEYLRGQSEVDSLRLKKDRQLYAIIGVAAMLLIAAIFMYTRWRIVRKDRQMDGYIDMAESMRKIINDKNKQLSALEEQTNSLNTKIDEMSGHIAALFDSHYDLFDRLIRIYYENSPSSKDKDAVYEQLRSEISRFSHDTHMIANLEEIINRYKCNILFYIKTEIPRISDRDIRLLCYIYAGFSAKSISVLVNESLTNVLTRKYRFKLKIERLNPPHAKLMLDEMP